MVKLSYLLLVPLVAAFAAAVSVKHPHHTSTYSSAPIDAP
jgi:hypothetical protein